VSNGNLEIFAWKKTKIEPIFDYSFTTDYIHFPVSRVDEELRVNMEAGITRIQVGAYIEEP